MAMFNAFCLGSKKQEIILTISQALPWTGPPAQGVFPPMDGNTNGCMLNSYSRFISMST